jgi:hypothetical protein
MKESKRRHSSKSVIPVDLLESITLKESEMLGEILKYMKSDVGNTEEYGRYKQCELYLVYS